MAAAAEAARAAASTARVNIEINLASITDEQAGNLLGAIAAATIPDPPKKKSCIITIPKKSAHTVTSAAEADLISDLVHKIENLNESDAKARLFELEDAHEKTYFEIGGVLSVMQREKWYDPCASLDEALDAIDKDREFLTRGGVFSNDMLDGYIALKMEEVTRFRMTTHPIEFDMYYAL